MLIELAPLSLGLSCQLTEIVFSTAHDSKSRLLLAVRRSRIRSTFATMEVVVVGCKLLLMCLAVVGTGVFFRNHLVPVSSQCQS